MKPFAGPDGVVIKAGEEPPRGPHGEIVPRPAAAIAVVATDKGLVIQHPRESVLSSDFCTDAKCKDASHPEIAGKPHYHIGNRTYAMRSVVWDHVESK